MNGSDYRWDYLRMKCYWPQRVDKFLVISKLKSRFQKCNTRWVVCKQRYFSFFNYQSRSQSKTSLNTETSLAKNLRQILWPKERTKKNFITTILEGKKARQLGPVSLLRTSPSERKSLKQTSLYVLENQLYLVFSASPALLAKMSTLFAKPYRCKTTVSFPCLRWFQTPITSFTLQWQALPSYLAFWISWNHFKYVNIY